MKKINATIGERVFNVVNTFVMLIIIIITLYPFLYVTLSSVSDPIALANHQGMIWKPIGRFTVIAYKRVFENPMIIKGYQNTIVYVLFGTAINLLLTSFGAYALSRKGYLFKKFFMFAIVLTMFFSGGLIPFYLQVKNLGLTDKIWALILPNAINTFNLIVMRTSFEEVPVSLEESARIDGANDFRILFSVILPVSMPVVAVMVLFYGVQHWNAWFNAMIFLRKRELYPLQLILREILITSSTDSMLTSTGGNDVAAIGESIKYATIMVATIPILAVYPFLQKYFVKGMMIGAVKG